MKGQTYDNKAMKSKTVNCKIMDNRFFHVMYNKMNIGITDNALSVLAQTNTVMNRV